ncbi:MAG: HD domain-containing protein [Candidatus Hadarchaeota archaeon]
MKRIPRMGWLEAGISPVEAEDVAQHTFETSSVALLLLDSVKMDLNRVKVLEMSIVHDWAEAVTGDFSREVSEQLGRDKKEEIEEKVLENILLKDLGEPDRYLELWKEYSNLKTNEAKLVRAADRISILLEATYLLSKGESSKKLKEIWETVRDELDGFCDPFPVLECLLENLDRIYSEDA